MLIETNKNLGEKKLLDDYQYVNLDNLHFINKERLEDFVQSLKESIRKLSHEKRKPFIITLDAGGTISMQYEESKFSSGQELISKEQDYEKHIKNLVPPQITDEYKFYNFPAFSLDSADIGLNHVADLVTVASYIYSELGSIENAQLTGIIICMGTDRMAETSTRFAFQIGKYLPLPIVFTGAQESMDGLVSDAPHNMQNSIRAITLMSKDSKSEVLTCFGNGLYRSVGTEKLDAQSLNGINSRLFEPIGRIKAGILYEIEKWAKAISSGNGQQKVFTPMPLYSDTKALSLLALPELDMNFDVLDIVLATQEKVGGILMPTFASGTVNTGAIRKLQDVCNQNSKILIVANHTAPHIESQYSSAQMVREDPNVLFLTMTRHAILAKFQQLCASHDNDLEKVAKAMKTNFIGEIPTKQNKRQSPIVF